MSVLPMKRALIVGLRKNRKQMLEYLQRLGVMEIEIEAPADEGEADPVFRRLDVSGLKTTLEKNAQAASQALATLDGALATMKDAPQKDDPNMFSGRKPMTLTDYETYTGQYEKAMQAVFDINALAKRQAEIAADIPKYEAQMTALEPWMTYELPLDFKGTRSTRAYVGSIPNEQGEPQIRAQLAEYAPDIIGAEIDIISTSTEQTCVQIVCHEKDAQQVEEALRHMGFARPPIAGGVPSEMRTECLETLAALRKESDEIRQTVTDFKDQREMIKFAQDYNTMRAEKYRIIGGIEQTDKVFLLKGYIPAKEAEQLERTLTSRFDCVVELTDPGKDDEDVPVALKNNWYAAPVEGVVTSYAAPGKGEVDPSFIAAIFYYFLFGMMLSDAAYGLIMIFGCAFLLNKYKATMEEGMRKTLTMFMYAGVGTTFWGIMFGSWFGDLPLTIVRTFINPEANFSLALWVEPTVEPMAILGFAFVVGIIHVFVGMGAAAYQSIKQGNVMDAVYDVFCWYLLLIGALGTLISTEMIQGMFNLHLTFSPMVLNVFKWMAIIGAVGVVLFGGRDSTNWVLRIGRGLYALYGITSYLSDVLSYSRLLALGLATGVISSVFNSMAGMVGSGLGGIVGAIPFALICIVGHALNLAINALGAYVHTNRLEYVEFFGKFYSGGGRMFAPFTENTKFFRVTE